jgi:hypothetical protein
LTCFAISTAVKLELEELKALKKYTWLIAAGVSLSLISKLTTIPQAVFLLLTCFSLSYRLVTKEKRVAFFKLVANSFGLALLITSPILTIEFSRISSYVYNAVFSNQNSIWTFSGSESNFDLIRILLSPSWQRLGGVITPSYLLLIIACILFSKRKIFWPTHGIFLTLMTVSFVILLLVRQQNEFFFSSIHAFALFGILELLYEIYYRDLRKQVVFTTSILVGSSLLLASLFIRFPNSLETKIPYGLNRSLVSTLRDLLPKKSRTSVFLSFTGPVNATTLNWYELQIGGETMFVDDALNSSLTEVVSEAKKFEFVVVPDSLRSDVAQGLPSSAFQNNVIAALLNSDYGVVQRFPDKEPHYYLLQRNKPSKIEVFVDDNNLTGIDGPFPNRGIMEKFRWTKADHLILCQQKIYTAPMEYSIPLMTELSQELIISSGDFTKTFFHTPGVFQMDKVILSAGLGTKCINITVPKANGRIAIATSFPGRSTTPLGNQ